MTPYTGSILLACVEFFLSPLLCVLRSNPGQLAHFIPLNSGTIPTPHEAGTFSRVFPVAPLSQRRRRFARVTALCWLSIPSSTVHRSISCAASSPHSHLRSSRFMYDDVLCLDSSRVQRVPHEAVKCRVDYKPQREGTRTASRTALAQCLSPEAVCDMDTMYPESRQTSREQADFVVNYLSQFDPLLRSPHEDSTITTPGVTDGTLWYTTNPLLTLPLGLPMTEEWVDTGNPALTLFQSAPLAQNYHGSVPSPASIAPFIQTPGALQTFQDHSTIASPHINSSTLDYLTPGAPQTSQDHSTVASPYINSTTFDYLTPGAPQIFQRYSTIASPRINDTSFDCPPPGTPQDESASYLSPTAPQPGLATLPYQIDSTTLPATTAPENHKQCPACQVIFYRRRDRDRHVLSYLPHWIHCPFPDCPRRFNRVETFKEHWQKKHHRGRIPEREQFEIFNPQEFVDQIIAGIPARVAADRALARVLAKADQLQKFSMSKNPWGYKLKQVPQ